MISTKKSIKLFLFQVKVTALNFAYFKCNFDYPLIHKIYSSVGRIHEPQEEEYLLRANIDTLGGRCHSYPPMPFFYSKMRGIELF